MYIFLINLLINNDIKVDELQLLLTHWKVTLSTSNSASGKIPFLQLLFKGKKKNRYLPFRYKNVSEHKELKTVRYQVTGEGNRVERSPLSMK